MKKIIYIIILFSLLLTPVTKLYAQSNITATEDLSFNRSNVPQWAKDLWRFDVITFGAFPFTMLFTTLIYDYYLRSRSVGMTGNYYANVLIIAGGAALTVALADLIIVLIKRNRERRRLENATTGAYEIEQSPYGEGEPDEPVPE